jgi:hypothetical protein
MFGPLYCSTPLALSLDIWSNAVIIGFAAAALAIVHTRAPKARDLRYLASLLLLTGLGSLYWHVLRTPVGLVFDSVPSVFFMLTFAYLWMRRLYNREQAVFLFSLFLLIEIISSLVAVRLHSQLGGFMYVPLTPAIIGFSLLLIYKSAARAARAAWLGFFAIASTLLGLLFRSIDLSICSSFPLGSHFLWHILVALGAYLAVLTLLELDKK